MTALLIQRGLGRDGWANREALQLERALDAGCKRVLRERLVDGPELALQRHRALPDTAPGKIVKCYALTGDDAGWTRHPAHTANHHHTGGNVRRGCKDLHPSLRLVHDRQ